MRGVDLPLSGHVYTYVYLSSQARTRQAVAEMPPVFVLGNVIISGYDGRNLVIS
jgi:hypothetical protein